MVDGKLKDIGKVVKIFWEKFLKFVLIIKGELVEKLEEEEKMLKKLKMVLV